MNVWGCYLQCPDCDREYHELRIGFNRNGDAHLTADCKKCGKGLMQIVPIESAMANALALDEKEAQKSAKNYVEFQEERIQEKLRDN